MTEKELKKLNRLEILELLLEQSTINENMRQELHELKNKNNAAELTENLNKMILQMNSALDNVNHIAENLQEMSKKDPEPENIENKNDKTVPFQQENDTVTNKNLYGRIMYFFWQNDDVLSSLPEELQKDIRKKLRGILNDRK
ncbi:MAG: hypothetical protein IKM66_05690 [Clostridia bacterium]|nr:hypothetical protein [Clostridia bacterium]